MKITDFRIGNNIFDSILKNECEVTIEVLSLLDSGNQTSHLSYVLITEEILLKYGAEEKHMEVMSLGGNNVWFIGGIILFEDDDTWWLMEKEETSLVKDREFKHLHELQNLHFAILGRELQKVL